MAISTLDELLAAMRGGAYTLLVNKASLGSQILGIDASLWTAAGFPAAGVAPTTAAICNNALTGHFPLAARSGAQNRIISRSAQAMATLNSSLFIEDRLGHMGGLSGTSILAQTVGLDLHANLLVDNIAQRIGNANYSEVQWYLEWYTATGATVSTPTAQVTFNDASTGSVNISNLGSTALPATVGAARRYKLTPTNGKYIRSVDTVTLSASTGTIGNFGVTAVRPLVAMPFIGTAANNQIAYDVWGLNAPEIYDSSCVAFAINCGATSSGLLSGVIQQAVN